MFGACKDAEGEKKIACKYQKRHERTNVFGVYPEQKSNSKQSVNIIWMTNNNLEKEEKE